MSDILVAKEIRNRFKAALSAADIAVQSVPVTVLETAPIGWVVPEDKLPALYVFASGESLSHDALSEVTRQLFLDVVLMARGGGDPMDGLDDLQLAVEQILSASGGFGLAPQSAADVGRDRPKPGGADDWHPPDEIRDHLRRNAG